MALAGSMHLSHELGIQNRYGCSNQPKIMMAKGQLHLLSITSSSHALRQDAWSLRLSNSMCGPITPVSSRCKFFLCRSFLVPGGGNEISVLKSAALVLTRSCNALQGSPLVLQLVPAVSIIAFATWGLGPVMRLSRNLFLNKTDSSWKKSSTYYVLTCYLQPLLLWIGGMLICRALDPIILPSKESQAVKQQLLIFIQSLSTVLAFAYCLSSLIQQAQKFFMESNDSTDARNIGFQFAGKAVYTAIWVAAVSLFMELLGFSTQKWLTAGGLGTVLLTLAGREIFTNFLSSVMIHATRPFVVNERIQTKIKDSEVSGTVEHVGWWSPTIIRGDDREAVHVPNHKFTVNVVRNLSQRTHWRIKTHLAISHLDVNKINNIVADMRKVLAKNPQVEQQRLHRRVFLDYIDPENQALLIMVSCFLKTPRIEEYLCVKEAILLDLLRVISHHGARLATPIRTFQTEYSDTDMENIPFADPRFTRSRAAANRPHLQIEPSYKINGDDKIKASTSSARRNKEKDAKIEVRPKSDLKPGSKAGASSILEKDAKIKANPKSDSKPGSKAGASSILEKDAKIKANPKSDSKPGSNAGASSSIDSTADNVAPTSISNSSTNCKVSEASTSDPKIQNMVTDGSTRNNYERQRSEVGMEKVREETVGLRPDDINQGGSAFEKHSLNFPESDTGKTDILPSVTLLAKQDGDRASIAAPALEENIVLGVALEGSKRRLPIEEEEMVLYPSTAGSKELAACRNGNVSAPSGKDKKKTKMSAAPSTISSCQPDVER